MLGATLVVAGSLAADRVPLLMLAAFVASMVADGENDTPAVFVTTNAPVTAKVPSPDTDLGAYAVVDWAIGSWPALGAVAVAVPPCATVKGTVAATSCPDELEASKAVLTGMDAPLTFTTEGAG